MPFQLTPHPNPSSRPTKAPKAPKLFKVAPEITKLDSLAALAEGFYALEHGDAPMDVDGAPRAGPRASATPGPGPGKNGELVVESQEDLKALTHIRKMMQRQEVWQDSRVKATLMGYFEGDMIVVSGDAQQRVSGSHRRSGWLTDGSACFDVAAAASCVAQG